MGMIRVQAMKNCWVEPVPGRGKLYQKGEIFMVEEAHLSDYDRERDVKDKDGNVVRKVRGAMRRVPDAGSEPLVMKDAPPMVETNEEPAAKKASRKVI